MEPCPYRQGELARSPRGSPGLGAAMEPCPYRQGEDGEHAGVAVGPAAAMEPCPYRQGESLTPLAQEVGESTPQWSPALIGRERA